MYKKIGLVLLLAGLGALFFFKERDQIGVVDTGKTEYIHTNVTNGKSKQLFFKETKQGHTARWSYDVYTIEGDPIHYTLLYDAQTKKYQVTEDTRDDKFGHPAVYQHTCTDYDYPVSQLIGCNTESGFFPVPGEVIAP